MRPAWHGLDQDIAVLRGSCVVLFVSEYDSCCVKAIWRLY